MSRLNSRQKRAAKVRAAIHALATARNASTQSTIGNVRTSLNPSVHLSAYSAPRDQADQSITGFISGAKRGKVVRGKFVPDRGTKKPFSGT